MTYGREGLPVLLLHGWGANSSLMLPVAKRINRYCIIPDMYGFGLTPHGDKPLFVKDYADGIIKLLDNLNVEKVDVIGHSFGGRVAIYLSTYYPNRINKLVLVDSAGIKPRRKIGYFVKVFVYKLRKLLKLDVSKYGSTDYKALLGPMKKTFVNVVNYDQKPSLGCIFCPTLIIWGRKDNTTPIYMAKIFNKKIKNSELFVIEKAGHFSYADNLDLFSIKLKAFLGAK